MSIDITLAGDKGTLLSHMSLLGAASILDEVLGAGSALCRWTDEMDASPVLRVDVASEEEVGEVLRVHASRHVDGEIPWMHAQHPLMQSLFATRAKVPSSDDIWGVHGSPGRHLGHAAWSGVGHDARSRRAGMVAEGEQVSSPRSWGIPVGDADPQ